MPTDAPRDHVLRAFDRIAERVSDACQDVDCTIVEYRLGLKSVISQLTIDLAASRADDVSEPDPNR